MKKFPQIPIDETQVAYVSNPEYETLKHDSMMESLRDRTVKVNVPECSRKQPLPRFQIVTYGNYGGFSLTNEMAEWLREHHGWIWATSDEYYVNKQINVQLVKLHNDMYVRPEHIDDLEFRKNPDLIACVKAMHQLHPDGTRNKSVDFKVKDVMIHVEIDSVDGWESLSVWAEQKDISNEEN